jgi:hypothetical protein
MTDTTIFVVLLLVVLLLVGAGYAIPTAGTMINALIVVLVVVLIYRLLNRP